VTPRFWSIAVFFLLLPLVSLTCCQHKLIYYPRPNPPAMTCAFLESGGHRLDFFTGEGRQTAWLRKPASGAVEKLWIVCGGNGTLALEMDADLRELAGPRDALLYFDYPGYGECDGAPTPGRIRASLASVVPAAAQTCGIPRQDLPTRAIAFGHSLGAAVALVAADDFGLHRAILLAPFTSTMDMARIVTGLPVGFLVTHRYDNRARLSSLTRHGARVWLIHGESDEAIPVAMGRELAAATGQAVSYLEIPSGRHNNLFQTARASIASAMACARQ
jgi:hypothetical protein